MSIADIGPRPQAFNLEIETLENPNYRTVAWSGEHLRRTLMSIPVGGDIGLHLRRASRIIDINDPRRLNPVLVPRARADAPRQRDIAGDGFTATLLGTLPP